MKVLYRTVRSAQDAIHALCSLEANAIAQQDFNIIEQDEFMVGV